MKIFKKQFSVLMTLLMVFTLVPISAFAEAKVSVVGGVQSFTTMDTNKEVKLLFEMEKFTDLNKGRVIFELDNAMLAKSAGAATATIHQGSKTMTAPDVVFVNTSGESLSGGEQMFNMEIKKAVPATSDPTHILVTLKLDFSKSNSGGVDLVLRDIGENGVKTGIGDYDSAIASDSNVGKSNPEIRVGNKDMQIGPAGGKLSSFTVYTLEKLSSKKEENQISIILPDGIIFDQDSKVETGKGSATVSYVKDKNEMVIKNIDSSSEFIKIDPIVSVQAKSNIKAGAIKPTFQLLVKNNVQYNQEIQIGQFAEFGITLTAKEKDEKTIPTLAKGQSKTIELTIDAVEGSLAKGDTIELSIDQAQIVYGTLKVTEPFGTLLTTSKSAGKDADKKVSSYEVYMENYFTIRTNKSDVRKIKITFDVIADPLATSNATIKAKTTRFSDQKIEIAKINNIIDIQTMPMTFEKGKIANLPAVEIKENEVNQLLPNDKIYLELVYAGSDREKGEHIAFQTAKDIKFETTNKLELQSVELGKQPNILVLTVKSRSYDKPGTIKLSNIKGYLTEKAAVGEVKIKASVNEAQVKEIPFFNIAGKATQGTTFFVIGQKTYTTNGAQKNLVTAPYINNGRTMLPVRAVSESLGLVAQWDNASKTATFANQEKVAIVKIGSSTITVNGMAKTLNVPAEIKNGSTMIELRSLAEAFDVNIQWNASSKTVTVN